MTRRIARSAAAICTVAVVLLASASPASAHPLGNVSVNHYAGLVVGSEETRVDYVVDLAELPTVRAIQQIDTDGDGDLGDAERAAYENRRCDELADGVDLRIAGAFVTVRSLGGSLQLLPGAAGLDILRLECDLRADRGVQADETAVSFTDTNPGGRIGWREVTAIGDQVTLDETDVSERSVSGRLVEYPEGVDSLDVTTAALVASPGGAPAPSIGQTPFGEQARAATDRFTSLIASDQVTIPLVATSLVVAMLFGALHSLAPGHGKSVIAAYLLGQQRDRRLAFLLGGTVAVTHTISVLIFGAVISLTETAAPEKYYPVFGVVSGLLFVALGVALLRQVIRRHRGSHPAWTVPAVQPKVPVGALAGGSHGAEVAFDDGHIHQRDHDHQHHHEHQHQHQHQHHHDHDDSQHGGWHEHEHVDLGAVASGELGWRGVVLPGLAGGLVPSPSALLVFLGGLALGRAWFGVGLVLGYGIGIAATLVAAGWLLARAGDRVTGDGALGRFPRLARLAGYLPAATAVLVILGGLHIAVRTVA